MGFILSPRAQSDLDEIWDYSCETWGVDQAERYIILLRDAVSAAAAKPARGRPCEDIRVGYRKLAAGSHVIFYRMAGSDIDVVRILHQRMDFARHL
jgi:toxin ParE1/3/4